ncbi:protein NONRESPONDING TO OXYLIPINS 2, mitochondrial isoform X1 [Oryza brachyantha]|uniref:protein NONRESPONDING TO OXYLIPINS 2, mitochondrial isoform X1 n=1 Tax=Oryza brachyantha TaxID=4533 RepID=UPI00077663A4|nr:protein NONRESPONDING TO OXYLIPINS 2, mitochondrial isoform X1 [Oryza brachyantha]
MASFCRAAAATVRAAARRPRSPAASTFQSAKHPASPPRLRRSFVAAALASADSLMPLHSAVAASRLRSCIAADSSCWSCLSQDFALPR